MGSESGQRSVGVCVIRCGGGNLTAGWEREVSRKLEEEFRRERVLGQNLDSKQWLPSSIYCTIGQAQALFETYFLDEVQ